ncbi:natterin-4-like protein [Leptotrombidium deliense]|uniref:Natterin-4-like protein n=1 Tax=Leptotrombidium deliense TaxID=299467 RepID=A0A443SMS2_9ACAR|nr:natterin-4-like protein [Leptotrombidium deliense]
MSGYGYGQSGFATGYPGSYPSAQPYPRGVVPPPTAGMYPQSGPVYPQSGPVNPGGRVYHRVVEWQDASHGRVPVGNPVIGGQDVNGEPLYIGSTELGGDLVPGKVVPSHGCCYIPYDGREHSSKNYHVLVNPGGCELIWIHASNGTVPTGAIQGGKTASGEPLFVGRHRHQGSVTVGKVHPSHGKLYLSFGGNEESYSEYEVLCCKHVSLM